MQYIYENRICGICVLIFLNESDIYMVLNATKAYSDHVGALVSNQVQPSGEYYS